MKLPKGDWKAPERMGTVDEAVRKAAERRAMEAINRALGRMVGRQPRYRYFKVRGSDKMFCWSTEEMGDGTYASWVYQPYGPGSRTPGKATRWKVTRERRFRHRNSARARALRLYETERRRLQK